MNKNIIVKGRISVCSFCGKSLSRNERLQIKGTCSKCEKEIDEEDIDIEIFKRMTNTIDQIDQISQTV